MNAYPRRHRLHRAGVAATPDVNAGACTSLWFRRLPGVVVLMCVVSVGAGLSAVVHAQSEENASEAQDMTIEELEAYIEQQKAELEQVRVNRDITAEKARKVKEALAEEAARREEALAEVERLCEEQEELEPGSLDACMASVDEP